MTIKLPLCYACGVPHVPDDIAKRVTAGEEITVEIIRGLSEPSNINHHVGGEMRGGGWTLAMNGSASSDATILYLRLTVLTRGVLLRPDQDHGISGDLWDGTAHGSWTLDLAREAGGGWAGRVVGREGGWCLTVTGAAVRPGVMRVSGMVEAT